jgi:DUF1016 N-terminal domain
MCGVKVAVAKNPLIVGKGYDEFLKDLKERIRTAQIKAALAVNRELVLLYWQIGRQILARQRAGGQKSLSSLPKISNLSSQT